MSKKSDESERVDQALSPEEKERVLNGFHRLMREQRAWRRWLRSAKGNEGSEKIPPNSTPHGRSRPIGMFSKLDDGRILWLRPSGAFTWDGKGWIPATGVGPASALEARLMTDKEIQDLISKGILTAD